MRRADGGICPGMAAGVLFHRSRTGQVREFFPLVVTSFIVMYFTVMTNHVTFFRALADSTRLRIVHLVMEEALCVCELAYILDMPQSSVSSHVQIIRKAGLLESEKCEKWTYFRIRPEFRKLLRTVDEFFEATSDKLFISDAKRSVKRLKERHDSCCPGPVLLVKKSQRQKP